MTLTGILKNILLVIISVVIWKTEISMMQGLGYAVALCGLVYYSIGYDQLSQGLMTAVGWTSDVWSNPAREGRLPRVARRVILIGGLIVGSLFVSVMLMRGYDIDNPLSKFPSLTGSS